MKEQIVTGKKFRILTDVTSRLWHVISFWTKAQDVEFNDGTNAQAKLGNIVGISDSLTSTASNVAASAKAVKVLNDKVVNQIGNLNGQINQKNQTINDLNNTISRLNAQIENLQNKDITNENINSLWLVKHSENFENNVESDHFNNFTYTATRNVESAYIVLSKAVKNHDNSSTGIILVTIRKNGQVYKESRDHVNDFGGGSCKLTETMTLFKGDTIELTLEGYDLQSCYTSNTRMLTVIGSFN